MLDIFLLALTKLSTSWLILFKSETTEKTLMKTVMTFPYIPKPPPLDLP